MGLATQKFPFRLSLGIFFDSNKIKIIKLLVQNNLNYGIRIYVSE